MAAYLYEIISLCFNAGGWGEKSADCCLACETTSATRKNSHLLPGKSNLGQPGILFFAYPKNSGRKGLVGALKSGDETFFGGL